MSRSLADTIDKLQEAGDVLCTARLALGNGGLDEAEVERIRNVVFMCAELRLRDAIADLSERHTAWRERMLARRAGLTTKKVTT